MVDFKRGEKRTSKPVTRGPFVVTIQKLSGLGWTGYYQRCSRCQKRIKAGSLYGYRRTESYCLDCVE